MCRNSYGIAIRESAPGVCGHKIVLTLERKRLSKLTNLLITISLGFDANIYML